MAQKYIDFGSFPDDPDADAIRTAFEKVQQNFTELYGGLNLQGVSSVNKTPGAGITVNSPTGNVIISANLAQVQVQTSTLSFGINNPIPSSTFACVNSSSQTLFINLPDSIAGIDNLSVLANSYTGSGIGNIYAENIIANTSLISNNNLTVSNLISGANLSLTGNASVTGNVDAGSVNISGKLSVLGSNSNIVGNLGVTSNVFAGNVFANSGTIKGTSLDISSNITAANITASTGIFTGNGIGLTNLAAANITGTVANATYADNAGDATTAGTVTENAQSNITSVGTLTSLDVSGNILGANIYANSGTIGANLLAGTLTTNAQPNITSLGILTGLDIGGNILPNANIIYDIGNNTNRFKDIYLANSTIYLGNATISANANSLLFTNPDGGQLVLEGSDNLTLGNISSINLNGNSDTVLKGDGTWGTGGGGGGGGSSIENGTSNIDIPTPNGNIVFTVNNIHTATFTTAGNTNILGNLNFSGDVPGLFINLKELVISQTVGDENNIYLCGQAAWSNNRPVIYSFNKAGGINWEIDINDFPGDVVPEVLDLQLNNNYLYATITYAGAPDYLSDLGILQLYTSNGNIANSWMLNASNSSYVEVPMLTFDSNNKPIVAGTLADEIQTDVVSAQDGSGLSLLIVNNSDLSVPPYVIPSGGTYNWLIQTDPLDPTITSSPQYINYFLNVPVVSVTGIGVDMTIRIKYQFDSGTSTWSYTGGMIESYGSDYANGDELKVLGSSIGGVDGVNDVTFTYSKPYWWYSGQLINFVSGPVPSTVSNTTRFIMSQSVDYSVPSNWTVKQYLDGQAFIWTENWQHSYGEYLWQTFRDAKYDSYDDSIYLTGQLDSSTSNGYSSAVLKLDASTGNTVWAKYVVDSDEPYADVGTINPDNTGNSFLIMINENYYPVVTKLDNDGNIIFQSVQQNTNNYYNYPTGGISSDGNIIVMGVCYNNDTYSNGLSISKLDKDTGDLIYSRWVLYYTEQQYYPAGYYDVEDYYNWYNIAGTVTGNSMYYTCYSYLNYFDGVAISLPSDGSGLGTYGSWNYIADLSTTWAISPNGVSTTGTITATDNDPIVSSPESVSVNTEYVYPYAPTINRIPGVGINNVVQLTFADGTVQESAFTGNRLFNGATSISIPNSSGNIEFQVSSEKAGVVGTSVALGILAGSNSNLYYSVAVGHYAGANVQGQQSVALGRSAGGTYQGNNSVAVGYDSGTYYQGDSTTAVGVSAGGYSQGNYSIAVGMAAGQFSQKELSVAVGPNAGQYYQGYGAVAIGRNAGSYYQGNYAIAIGFDAGSPNYAQSAMATNSIILNASGNYMTADNASLYVNPIRQDGSNTLNALYYNTTTKEITYSSGGGGSSGVLTPSNINSTTTLTQALAGQMLRITSSSYNIVIPNDSEQVISQGSMYTIVNQNIGNPQITRNSGVTLYTAGGSNSNKAMAAYSVVELYKVSANTWMVSGQSITNS